MLKTVQNIQKFLPAATEPQVSAAAAAAAAVAALQRGATAAAALRKLVSSFRCLLRPAMAVSSFSFCVGERTLEDRKYGCFWIFPHHSCENIQKYFEFLDTFGYSPIIPEQLPDVLGGRSPP